MLGAEELELQFGFETEVCVKSKGIQKRVEGGEVRSKDPKIWARASFQSLSPICQMPGSALRSCGMPDENLGL